MRRNSRDRPVFARQCPRCRQRGEGVSYLRRPGRLALLVGASALTYGIGGLVVHGLCGGHRYCPHCGVRWRPAAKHKFGPLLDRAKHVAGAREEEDAVLRTASRIMLPALHVMRFVGLPWGLYGVFRATAGILGGDLSQVLDGLVWATIASMLFVMAWRERLRPSVVNRDDAHKVLRLADRCGGVLSTADVATELDVGLDDAEQLMTAMEDGFRVRSDIGGDGVVRYKLPEVLHHKRLEHP